jgi:hypothetical protein
MREYFFYPMKSTVVIVIHLEKVILHVLLELLLKV